MEIKTYPISFEINSKIIPLNDNYFIIKSNTIELININSGIKKNIDELIFFENKQSITFINLNKKIRYGNHKNLSNNTIMFYQTKNLLTIIQSKMLPTNQQTATYYETDIYFQQF